MIRLHPVYRARMIKQLLVERFVFVRVQIPFYRARNYVRRCAPVSLVWPCSDSEKVIWSNETHTCYHRARYTVNRGYLSTGKRERAIDRYYDHYNMAPLHINLCSKLISITRTIKERCVYVCSANLKCSIESEAQRTDKVINFYFFRRWTTLLVLIGFLSGRSNRTWNY